MQVTRLPPTPAGIAAITPFRMSAEQVADLVERTREASKHSQSESLRMLGWWPSDRRMTSSRVAARLVELLPCTTREATDMVRSVSKYPLTIDSTKKALNRNRALRGAR